MHKLADLLPEEFRVLYRQFFLRIVDFEALSAQADVVGYLGQFAGVLIMLSLVHAFAALIYVSSGAPLSFAWHMEQYLIKTMMLVTGLFAILTWDATFPDKRDIAVLSPLPIASHAILSAKLAASGFFISGDRYREPRLRSRMAHCVGFAAWRACWGVALHRGLLVDHGGCEPIPFLFHFDCAGPHFDPAAAPHVLAFSAVLQLAAFALFIGTFFLQPVVSTRAGFASPKNYHLINLSPTYWFFALFNRMIGFGITELDGRTKLRLASPLPCSERPFHLHYVTSCSMRTTMEEPDIVSVRRGLSKTAAIRSSLTAAITVFSVRSLLRSRQHRVVLAFYLGIGFVIALFCVRATTVNTGFTLAQHPIDSGFLMATAAMMSFAVVGLRSCFALPISLHRELGATYDPGPAVGALLRSNQAMPPITCRCSGLDRIGRLFSADQTVWTCRGSSSGSGTPRVHSRRCQSPQFP